MKFAGPQPSATGGRCAEAPEVAKGIKTIQDGRIYLEEIERPFVLQLKGSPDEFKAGLRTAVSNGWLDMHESGSFVRTTRAGANLFGVGTTQAPRT